jgi:hypothetical protein
MVERRREQRQMCSQMARLRLPSSSGRAITITANLEDISSMGACAQVDSPLAAGAQVELLVRGYTLPARIRYCVHRDPLGYIAGMEFVGVTWSEDMLKPDHLFDPRTIKPKRSHGH